MKKALSILLAVFIIFSAAGCSVIGGKQLTRGTWDGNVFTSEYLGIKFTMPEGWTAASDEQIASLMNLSAEVLEDKLEFDKRVLELTTVNDMMASSPMGDSIMLIYENLVVQNATKITAEQYLGNVKSMMTQTGLDYKVNDSLKTINIGENEFTSLTATVSTAGIELSQEYYVAKVGNYMAGIVIVNSSLQPGELISMVEGV